MQRFLAISMVFLLFLPCFAEATPLNNMSPQQLEHLFKQAKEMQQCLQKVDPKLMQRVQNQANDTTKEIRKLCKNGKHAIAQKHAVAFSKKVTGNKEVQVMRTCGTVGEALMGTVHNYLSPYGDDVHVCDTVK